VLDKGITGVFDFEQIKFVLPAETFFLMALRKLQKMGDAVPGAVGSCNEVWGLEASQRDPPHKY
jgi:hypothetical protein